MNNFYKNSIYPFYLQAALNPLAIKKINGNSKWNEIYFSKTNIFLQSDDMLYKS